MSKKRHFFVTCQRGFENIVRGEIKEKISEAENIVCSDGKVFFELFPNNDKYLLLRCVDNVYLTISKFNIGLHKTDLKQLYNKINNINVKEILKEVGLNNSKKIIVSASRKGKHTYSRFELAQTVSKSLARKYNWSEVDSKSYDVAFRLDLIDKKCTFSVQLTSPEFKFRGDNYCSSAGGIRPSIAHCLVRESEPKGGDIFLDPFCGAGTIPNERAYYSYKKIFARDLSSVAADKARENLKGYDNVIVSCRDACDTKMKDNGVDVIITNMPWGKQIVVDDIKQLYLDFLKEAKRIIKQNGKIIILTDQDELVSESVLANDLLCEKRYELSLHGLHPNVYYITKKDNNVDTK